MLSLKQIKTITIASLAGTVLLTSSVVAQQSEFERRADAMRRARGRQMNVEQPANGYRTASRPANVQTDRQPAPDRQARSQRTTNKPAARTRSATVRPPRVAKLPSNARPSGSGMRVAQNLGSGMILDEGYVDGGYIDQGYTDDGYYEGESGCSSCGDSGCNSCGNSGSYFESGCDDGSCCGRGGCPPGDCWLSGLGGILFSGEYFIGATGFQGTNYRAASNEPEVHDCNFGFYGGANFGIPLCRLTCGVLSGQFGVRSVQSNFSGSEFTDESRDQLFVTAGVYRRVDYGFQFGVVGDFLQDEYFTDASVAQLRTDLSWVFAGGCQMGFRYTSAQEDDVTTGTFNGNDFTGLTHTVEDQYRFYLRNNSVAGGYGELFAGWTESDQTILGMDFDLPIHERIGLESSFTYFLHDEGPNAGSGFLGGNADEAWNIAVGIVLRPQGRSHYKSYDRPMFDVADNGSMLIRRGN